MKRITRVHFLQRLRVKGVWHAVASLAWISIYIITAVLYAVSTAPQHSLLHIAFHFILVMCVYTTAIALYDYKLVPRYSWGAIGVLHMTIIVAAWFVALGSLLLLVTSPVCLYGSITDDSGGRAVLDRFVHFGGLLYVYAWSKPITRSLEYRAVLRYTGQDWLVSVLMFPAYIVCWGIASSSTIVYEISQLSQRIVFVVAFIAAILVSCAIHYYDIYTSPDVFQRRIFGRQQEEACAATTRISENFAKDRKQHNTDKKAFLAIIKTLREEQTLLVPDPPAPTSSAAHECATDGVSL